MDSAIHPVRKKYLVLYFALALPLAWLFWIPMALINQGWWTPPIPIPILVLSTLGAVSPLVTLAIIERVSHKQVQLGAILNHIRLKEWRSPWVWFSAAFYPIVTVILTLLYFGVDRSAGPLQLFNPEVFAEMGWLTLLVIPVQFFPALLTSPFFEEPGWRGFAFDNLRRIMPRAVASLIVGSYWWVWHQGMNVAFGVMPTFPGFLSMLLDSWAIDTLYLLSGCNVFAAMLAHQAMGTAFTFLFPLPEVWYLLIGKATLVALLHIGFRRRETGG